MKVLVTGGLGYIGSHTVVALAEAGHQVVVVDNLSNSRPEVQDQIHAICKKTILVYHFDVRDTERLIEVAEEECVDAIIHFAAFLQVEESTKNPVKYYKNNLDGCISVLEMAKTLEGLPIVFSSSCTVYGNPQVLPVSESESIKKSESPYGQTKIICEQLIEDMCYHGYLKGISLRYFNPIGAHPSGLIGELQMGKVPHHLVPYVTEVAIGKREELSVFGSDYPTEDGTCVRDYIHVMDLAEAHVKAVEFVEQQKLGHYDAINIGTGKGSSVLEVINAFEEATNLPVKFALKDRRPGDVAAVFAQAEKAKQKLGWTAKRTLTDALRDAWNWEKSPNNR